MTTTTYAAQRNLVVRRTVAEGANGRMWWEVSVLRRHDQRVPTYQGEISMREGGDWVAIPATPGAWTGHKIGPFGNYADAEQALLKLRTGVRSAGPRHPDAPAAPVPPVA